MTIGAGTASAEGPRRTAAAQDWGFRTYGPFRVRRHECGWGGRCTPFDPWRVELTNPVDAKKLRKELVRVEPDLPGLKVEAWGDTLALRGVPRGRTTYRVTLSSEIADAFGQPLEPGPALAFAVGAAPAALFAPGGDFVVLDPAGGDALPGALGQPRLAARRGLRGGPRGLGGVAGVPAEGLARRGGLAPGPARDRHDGARRRRAGRAHRDAARPHAGPRGRARPGDPRRATDDALEGASPRAGPGVGPGDPHRARRVRRPGDPRRVGE